MRFLPLVLLLSVCCLAPSAAPAADQPILGKSLEIANPEAAKPSRRKVVVNAREAASPNTVAGDPTTPPTSAGAMLQVLADGGTPSAETFTLPQGTAANGKPFWRPVKPAGFQYVDKRGEQGPVQSVLLQRASNGTVQLKARIRGDIDVVPPNPGTQAFLLLTLGTGDRYCVQFGPDGVLKNRDTRVFSATKPTSQGCPAQVAGDFLALSYNVAGLPQGISGSDPEINTPLIAPLLNGYDLVLMQETWKTPTPNPLAPTRVYHEILEAGSLHPFKSLSALQPFGSNPMRPSAIVADGLNTFSRFPFSEIVRVPWTNCHESAADCLALKGFSFVRMTFAPGVVVDVYDLHMEAGGDPQDDVLRDQGVTQLSNFIQANSAGRAVIVGGDFNLHTNAEPDSSQFQRLLAETGLQDVCAALSCPEPGRIDKMLFRNNAQITLTPLSWHFETDVFVRDGNVPLSDHEALAVRFAWTLFPD